MSEMVEKKLADLPPTEDEYWEHSKIEMRKMDRRLPCEHFFVVLTGREMKCQRCGAGRFMEVGDSVIEGKHYNSGQIVN